MKMVIVRVLKKWVNVFPIFSKLLSLVAIFSVTDIEFLTRQT